VAAVVGIILLLHPFGLGREIKALAVDTVSTAVLVDLSDPVLSSLKLTYKDVSVSRLTVTTIEVRNSGTRPIERADFELPLVIRFNNPNDVLAVTLGQKTPQELKPLISSDDRGITIAPLLLNPGDTFRITVQLRGDFNEPIVEARISGVPSISREMFHASDPTRLGLFQVAIGVVVSVFYFYFVILICPPVRRGRPFTLVPLPESLVTVVALGFASVLLLVAGTKTLHLGLSEAQAFSGYAIFGLLCGSVLIPFALRRNSQLVTMLKP
jgi:hypothetical protein